MRISLLCGVWFLLAEGVCAQQGYRYFVEFADKKHSPYTLSHPEAFLSKRALLRRQTQGLKPDSTDLPVSQTYVAALKPYVKQVLGCSRWLNGVLVVLPDKTSLVQVQTSAGVRALHYLGAHPAESLPDSSAYITDFYLDEYASEPATDNVYGKAYTQVSQLGVQHLHQRGLKGQGLLIAVLDAGFKNVDKHRGFAHLYKNGQLAGSRDLISGDTNVYNDDDHGTHVLSCMAVADSGYMTGTAPGAGYYLIRTEEAATELPSEEIYWTLGAELADSLGADMIQASLGYTTFDEQELNHQPDHLNGHTSWVAKAAGMAVSKGMLVCVSNGNEGNSTWQYCGTPADAAGVVSVGAVDENGIIAAFSSRGFGKNGPNPTVVAMGEGTLTATASGGYRKGNGTSYAAPLLCGAMACLKAAFPNLPNDSLISIVKLSGNHYLFPCEKYGNGLPNLYAACGIAQGLQDSVLLACYDKSLGGVSVLVSSQSAGNLDVLYSNNEEIMVVKQLRLNKGVNHFFIKTDKSSHYYLQGWLGSKRLAEQRVGE